MSLEAVRASIEFYGTGDDERIWQTDPEYLDLFDFSNDGHKQEIISAIEYLWLGSAIARSILNQWVFNGGKLLFGEYDGFGKVNPYIGGADGVTEKHIGLNIDKLKGLNSINLNGETNSEFLPLVIMHEIIHLVYLTDNNAYFDPVSRYDPDINPGTAGPEEAGFDFSGATVNLTNAIAVQLGLEDLQRSSYQASSEEWILPDGLSYTNRQRIDATILGNDFDQKLDTSNQGGSRDLLLALGGNDQLRSGDGDDHLWGGAGDDFLDGRLPAVDYVVSRCRLFGWKADDAERLARLERVIAQENARSREDVIQEFRRGVRYAFSREGEAWKIRRHPPAEHGGSLKPKRVATALCGTIHRCSVACRIR